jgi:hypothetical protein
MIPFSQDVQARLAEGGWYARREIDLTAIIATLAPEGFVIFDAAAEILRSVQGVMIRTPRDAALEFEALLGLGTFEDLLPWMQANAIRLYPLSFHRVWCKSASREGSCLPVPFGDCQRGWSS